MRLDGVELWQRGVDALHDAGIGDVVVVGDVPGGLPGGTRRRDSVAVGLAAVPDGVEWVLIHDASRPLVAGELIRRVLERARRGDVDGVVPAVPISDTIKTVDGESVVRTISRDDLVAVQTPQAFRFGMLRSAHDAHGKDATDDASLVEQVGGTVVHVMGDRMNIKITYPADFAMAQAYVEGMALDG